MSHKMDQWDRQIIAILQTDGRASNVDIARQLGLSEATVRKRLERLLASGLIHVVAVADPERIGLETRMIIAIQAELGQLETLAQRLAQIPEVRSVDIITGTYDIIIEVALSSTGQLLSFLLDKVVAIPGVKRTDTYHVLKAVKRPSDWTVPEEASAEVGHAGRRSTQSVVPGAIVLPT